MQVELAKSAGFCFGVQRAVDTVYKQIEENSAEKIYTYGPIIHNEEVIKDMEKKGVEVTFLGCDEKGTNPVRRRTQADKIRNRDHPFPRRSKENL